MLSLGTVEELTPVVWAQENWFCLLLATSVEGLFPEELPPPAATMGELVPSHTMNMGELALTLT